MSHSLDELAYRSASSLSVITRDTSILSGDAWNTLTHTRGAVLLGAQVALFLSGAVFVQGVVYLQMYPSDNLRIRSMVFAIWFLDILHTAMIFVINWEELIVNFGNQGSPSRAIWPIPISIGITAWTTFLVHGFFSYRVHTLSRGKWVITGTLVTLSVVRLVAGMVSIIALLHYGDFALFNLHFKSSLILALSTSAFLDVLVTSVLCYYLRQRRSGLAGTNRMVDLLTLYTVENGMLTCIATTAVLICWATMPTNLIFFALQLVIGKLYANTFLASLNARRSLSHRGQNPSSTPEGYSMSILWPNPPRVQDQVTPWAARARGVATGMPKPVQVNIDIEQTIQLEEARRGTHTPVDLERPDSFFGGFNGTKSGDVEA